MQVIDSKEDGLLRGQPVEQPANRLEQPRSLHACVAERSRRGQTEAVEQPSKIGQPFHQPGPSARLDRAHQRAQRLDNDAVMQV